MPFAAFVLVGAVALGGCSGEEAPEPSPSVSSGSSTGGASPSASVTPSPTVTESGPAIPAAAREQTEAGAEAFVRFYIDQSARAWTEADPSQLEGLATGACATCANLQETATSLKAEGQRYSATPVKVGALSSFRDADTQQVFDAELQEQKVSILAADGEVVESFPARSVKTAIAVVWREGRWWLDAIGE